MQLDSTRLMDQARIPGILRLDKTSHSSGFGATPLTSAAMQVFHFIKNLTFVFCYSRLFLSQNGQYIFNRVFSSLTLELFRLIFKPLLNLAKSKRGYRVISKKK